MTLKDLKNKSILILGLGREGQTTLKFLKKLFSNQKIDTADQKDGKDYLNKLKDYDVIIKSPGIPYLPEINKAQQKGKIITSATAIFLNNCKGRVIGVTGTKGKSTTAALIYAVLKNANKKVYLIGNIGTPALDLLDQDSKDVIFVYELSSFQLEDLDKSPHIAVITNIYPEHLDRHQNLENYIHAKANITRFQTEKDILIYNQNNPYIKKMLNISKALKIPFSSDEFSLDNTTPAIILGKKIGISDVKIKKAIKNFKPLPHRLEFVGEFKGIRFYNDSLATIPQATIAALKTLGKEVETLITGGFDRGIDYSILGPVIDKSTIKNLILFPTTGEKIWKATSQKIKKFEVDNMKDAVRIAFEKTSGRKIVLLSPASSSFNLFKDYEDRGNQFKKAVISYK